MRTADKTVLAVAGLAGVALGAFMVFKGITDRQLAQSLAKVQKPPRVAFYEMLAADQKEGATELQDTAPEQVAPDVAQSLQEARETIAAYADLFARKSSWLSKTGQDRKLFFHTSASDSDGMQRAPAAPDDLIKLIRKTAKLGGPLRASDLSEEDVMAILCHADIGDCVVLLAEHAKRKLEGGDCNEALEDFAAAMDLADALAGKPLLLAQYFRQVLFSRLEEYLGDAIFPAEFVVGIVDRLAQEDRRDLMRDALAGELESRLQTFKEWENETFHDLVREAGVYWGTRSYLWARPMCRPWFNRDQQVCIDMTTRMLEVADSTYYEAKPVLDRIRADIDGLPYTNYVAQNFARWQFLAFARQADFEARLDVMQMGILLEQYRAQHGGYPETLDAIADGLGGTLPVDPFTGGPYHYELRNDTCLVSSSGPENDPDSAPAYRGRGSQHS